MPKRTHNQRLACKRNSAKWRMLGLLAQLKNLACNVDYTPHERERFKQAADILSNIDSDWNCSNTYFGLKNPDNKEES